MHAGWPLGQYCHKHYLATAGPFQKKSPDNDPLGSTLPGIHVPAARLFRWRALSIPRDRKSSRACSLEVGYSLAGYTISAMGGGAMTDESGSRHGFAAPADAPISYLRRLREYYEVLGYGAPYEWAHYADAPFQPLGKPLAEFSAGQGRPGAGRAL
jgi:hypothetical protein